jgi:hypothetical protein
MTQVNLKEGLKTLEDLAWAEYHQSLDEVLAEADAREAALRIGRLIGVLLKQPFAHEHALTFPSAHTRAFRGWSLVDEAEFPTDSSTWQYCALLELQQEFWQAESDEAQVLQYHFLFDAHNERGFFGYLAKAIRRYICGDPVVRARVEELLQRSGRSDIGSRGPDAIITSGGATLGVYLIDAVPLLGTMGASVVAALTLILYRLGAEGFCDWSTEAWSGELRTGDEEK